MVIRSDVSAFFSSFLFFILHFPRFFTDLLAPSPPVSTGLGGLSWQLSLKFVVKFAVTALGGWLFQIFNLKTRIQSKQRTSGRTGSSGIRYCDSKWHVSSSPWWCHPREEDAQILGLASLKQEMLNLSWIKILEMEKEFWRWTEVMDFTGQIWFIQLLLRPSLTNAVNLYM